MERALQWILVLAFCTSSAIIILAENNEQADRKLANIDYSGVISIDCGENEGYTDKTTNIQYQADDIQCGKIYNVSSNYSFNNISQIKKQLNTLRSFPNGTRNCYTLKPKQGKNNKYIIRAYFAYGNYDNKNKPPIFDLHLGVNFFKRINLSEADPVVRIEAIHFASTDTIDLCLVNIEQGVPFISLLELWPLDSSVYQTSPTLLTLDLLTRINLGVSEDNNSFIRYMDDEYGRSWQVQTNCNENLKKTSSAIDLDKLVDLYKLPSEILSTAVETFSNSLEYIQNYDTYSKYYVYLHFFDFEERENKQKRILNITINNFHGNVTPQVLTLSYWEPNSIVLSIEQGIGIYKIVIEATIDSDLPAMLNALEIYREVPQSDSATQQNDVDAMLHIKDFYKISRMNWQGDPCEPKNFTWEGVTCSNGDTPRIISLNLSSSKLSGEIDVSFSNLTYLESLDLSNNELTGDVPEYFAELSRLKILNLSRNKLLGPIPKSLKENPNHTLQLSLDGNLGPCQTRSSCKGNNQKFIVPLVVSITTFVAVLIICIIVMVIRRLRKNEKVITSSSVKDEPLKSTNQEFSYSEILSITNNFETMIGKGGFGKVYLGTLQQSDIRVAVKTLSWPSAQRFKEFQSEAKVLMHVHHRNVVSFVGYCDEGETKALVYEYLSEGNLQQKLSDKNPNVLEWTTRLKIAMEAANGLDYLHNGCKPPIIHRDLKTSNILLDENMHAKISDFGVSKTFANDTDTYITTYPAGTPGYVDPEFVCSGTLNKKSDVYSFGIILLELITGQPALRGTPDNLSYILPWVNLKLRTGGDVQEIVDPRLQGKYNVASTWKFLGIAMSCLPQVPIHRPDISHIASELKECLSLEMSLERTVSNVRDSFIMSSSRQIEFSLSIGEKC